ncbi:hypothetical protein [Algoriphagus taiwanensis]|uniref:Uncharacterized protein n=1 Tax=Algoriphagus taiwanensis TaxID=1445656 RepID=A0ABQ6Q1Q3_9BACT|nr:hypothetical protein Ataiwa_17970 [Algoriphagus taiwanensis]
MEMISATEKELKCILYAKSLETKKYLKGSESNSNSFFLRLRKLFSINQNKVSSSSENTIINKPLVSINKTLKVLWRHHGPSKLVSNKSKIDCLCFWVKELHGLENEIILNIEKEIRKKRKEKLASNREMFEKHQIEILVNFGEIESEIIKEIDKIYGYYIP